MKFKVGNKIKVVKDTRSESYFKHGLRLGRVGVVIGIQRDCCPYGVKLRNRSGTWWFAAREL